MPAESFDACVTDPPYELGFMGKAWDQRGVAFDPVTWAAVLRVLKPGAHLMAFGGTRTFHRMAVAIEDAGFELRDTVMWMYGTGFPKSHDVSKAVHATLTVGGSSPRNRRQAQMGAAYVEGETAGKIGVERAMERVRSASRPMAVEDMNPEAAAWQGWGTALKPAWEPIIVARKPLIGTVAENVLQHGTGALNIDGCRIEGGERPWREARRNEDSDEARNAYGKGLAGSMAVENTTQGRWPANVIHDGSDEVLAAFGAYGEKGGGDKRNGNSGRRPGGFGGVGSDKGDGGPNAAVYADSGTAARFFYSAKASKADRAGSKHPTVKPLALMRYLCRLVTPPGGSVLDPFAGSGTTGEAACLEGFTPTLIEAEAEHVADIRRRMARTPLDSRRAPVLTCYNDQPTGAKMPTLITFATDNPEDAKRIMEALYGAPAQEALPLPATPKAPRGAAAKAPDPASTVTTTVTPPAAPAAPVPTPPAAVVPPPTPAPPPPAPVAAPVAQAQPEPGWTMEHVKGMAKAFLTNPKGGPDKLEEVLKRHGAEAVGTASPGVWHLLYADMAAILEAA